MKRILIKVIWALLILIILFSIHTEVCAWSGIIRDGQSFIQDGENSGEASIVKGDLQDLSGFLYNMLLVAGVIIAVIVATVLGVQFMIGGAEGQAKVKEMLVPFIAGCIIVFGGFGFWKIAVTIGNKLESQSSTEDPRADAGGVSAVKCSNCGETMVVKVSSSGGKRGTCPKCGYTTMILGGGDD